MKTGTRKSKSKENTNARTPGAKVVQFKFAHPTARAVCIAGTFNDWNPTTTQMKELGGGQWSQELALPPGAYEYRFVADAEWMSDPSVVESAPNPFGGVNSILRVSAD
jgi:1,4-alpha-glucan branching enzyme